jgi:hypothetical protein
MSQEGSIAQITEKQHDLQAGKNHVPGFPVLTSMTSTYLNSYSSVLDADLEGTPSAT